MLRAPWLMRFVPVWMAVRTLSGPVCLPGMYRVRILASFLLRTSQDNSRVRKQRLPLQPDPWLSLPVVLHQVFLHQVPGSPHFAFSFALARMRTESDCPESEHFSVLRTAACTACSWVMPPRYETAAQSAAPHRSRRPVPYFPDTRVTHSAVPPAICIQAPRAVQSTAESHLRLAGIRHGKRCQKLLVIVRWQRNVPAAPPVFAISTVTLPVQMGGKGQRNIHSASPKFHLNGQFARFSPSSHCRIFAPAQMRTVLIKSEIMAALSVPF